MNSDKVCDKKNQFHTGLLIFSLQIDHLNSNCVCQGRKQDTKTKGKQENKRKSSPGTFIWLNWYINAEFGPVNTHIWDSPDVELFCWKLTQLYMETEQSFEDQNNDVQVWECLNLMHNEFCLA